MKRIRAGTLILALVLPLLTGMLSAAISSRGMAAYGTMNKPPLSPPAWVFSVAWTILYLMMGLATYYIAVSDGDNRKKTISLVFYAIQLVMNFFWSIIFFNMGMYLLAFIWLIVLWFVVVSCTYRFFEINRMAAYLMVPYVLWLMFAAYLNIGAYALNIAQKQ